MNPITKELAKMLKATLKSAYPYATWKVSTHRGNTIDKIAVEFDGEVDLNGVYQIAKSWETDSLLVQVSGNSYKLI
jgi:hypothetical protein